MVSIRGLIKDNMKEIGFLTKCMVTEYSPGQMDESMKVNILMTKKKDMEYSRGQIVENMMVSGSTENKRVQAYISIKREKLDTESGSMAREINGLP
jgi:hypothetical protein